MLLGVLAILAASYAFPARAWLDQRAQYDTLTAERDALTAEVDDLQGALELWDDPAYVRAQARERLNYVLPGEVGIVVLGTQSTPDEEPADGAVVPVLADDLPWWSTVVAAFREVGAGDPAVDAVAGPAHGPAGGPADDPADDPAGGPSDAAPPTPGPNPGPDAAPDPGPDAAPDPGSDPGP